MTGPGLLFLETTLPTAVENVALDEALLVEAEERDGPSILRIWELGHLAVVMGASCRRLENLRVEACRQDGIEVARRSSGGGTVVIGPGALNVSVILPIDAAPELKGVDTAQKYVLGRTLEAIREFSPAAEMRGSGDLTLNLRKFSGSAQRRLRRHVLVHATLLYDFPLDRIARYTRMPPRRPDYREDRDHEDFVTNLPIGRERLESAVRGAWLDPESGPARPEGVIPRETLRTLIETKFSEIGWIERL